MDGDTQEFEICENCGAELAKDGSKVLITVATETAERTGFTREVVLDYFHKNPPLVVCGHCARIFEEWDLSRVKLIGRLAPRQGTSREDGRVGRQE